MTNLQKIEENLLSLGKKVIYGLGLVAYGSLGIYLFLMGSTLMAILGVLIIVSAGILAI